MSRYDDLELSWRGDLTDREMVELVESYDGNAVPGWWETIRNHSFGWVTARDGDGLLVGFANVVSDGADHAFLIDVKTRHDRQRQGLGARVVGFATEHARATGHEWLHVDFEPHLRSFYFDACGFRPADAGLIHLTSL